MMPPCTSERIGVITWSPLARGRLTPQHLDNAAAALGLTLDAAEIASLEAPHVPHAIAGHA